MFAIIASDILEQKTVILYDIKGHWSESKIMNLLKRRVVNGYPDGSFKPNNPITRAEFVAILVKALELQGNSDMSFNDLDNHWAKNYLKIAYALGIVSGFEDRTFKPNDFITREQMAVMIVKAKKFKDVLNDKEFADKDEIASWAKHAIDSVIVNALN